MLPIAADAMVIAATFDAVNSVSCFWIFLIELEPDTSFVMIMGTATGIVVSRVETQVFARQVETRLDRITLQKVWIETSWEDFACLILDLLVTVDSYDDWNTSFEEKVSDFFALAGANKSKLSPRLSSSLTQLTHIKIKNKL